MSATLHMLGYLKGIIDVGLFCSNSPGSALTAYLDSNYVAFLDTRRSVSGFCVFFGDCLMVLKSKTQLVVFLSFTEAEY